MIDSIQVPVGIGRGLTGTLALPNVDGMDC